MVVFSPKRSQKHAVDEANYCFEQRPTRRRGRSHQGAYDPVGRAQARPLLPTVGYVDDAYTCAEGANALVIVTEWEQFRALDLARLKAVMARPIIVDLRNIYPPTEVAQHGFLYRSIGRALAVGRSPARFRQARISQRKT